jgi:hypothetical protein
VLNAVDDVSRKGAKKNLRTVAALCAFAPLREKYFPSTEYPLRFSTFLCKARKAGLV